MRKQVNKVLVDTVSCPLVFMVIVGSRKSLGTKIHVCA